MERNKAKDLRTIKALSRLFTDKQITILRKLINAESLTKQENEIYSRTLKPKINAIIDIYDISVSIRDKI